MDFSTVPRALESLCRRQPALDDRVQELSKAIDESCRSEESDSGSFLSDIEELVLYKQQSTIETSASRGGVGAGERWEPLAVGLFVATEILKSKLLQMGSTAEAPADAAPVSQAVYMEGPRVPTTVDVADETVAKGQVASRRTDKSVIFPSLTFDQTLKLCKTLHYVSMQNIEHSEPRVRTLVAKAVGEYCKVSLFIEKQQQDFDGTDQDMKDMRKDIYDRLVESINSHIQTGRDADKDKYSKSSTGALDDTTGWRALETNWQCLAALISALRGDYLSAFPLSESLLQDCQYSAVDHVNRHVRAAAMAVLEQLIVAAASSAHSDMVISPTSSLRSTVAAVLRTGLADNWSQVRMAASVLCRVFFSSIEDLNGSCDDLYPLLLPRMCLNRFYLAQGVKLYSHETWKLVVKDNGINLVAQNLPAVCRYYVKMCDADNHVVREAACQAIAELSVRLGGHAEYHETLKSHIDLLLQALLMCFHDESWPVRDEACLACGILCKNYSEECRPELKTLWERWTEQLTDQIWSVREDAAVALGDALEAYGVDFLNEIRKLLTKLLPSAREQPAMTMQEFKAHQNDMEAHSGGQMYSCGSLAPKLGKKSGAGRIGGCSSCGINRPKAPWEATDGCIYLIRELCIRCSEESLPIYLSDDELLPLMRELADVCRVQHFPQSSELRATLWRQLPAMANALGKQRFKRLYLDVFLDLMFSNLEARTASQLSIHAAGQCAEELASLVGVSIFRARLEDYQREIYDRVVQERKLMPKGPTDAAAFSPYGPPGLLDSVNGNGASVFPGRA